MSLVEHYANGSGSLFVGYRNFHRLDELRLVVERSGLKHFRAVRNHQRREGD
jgi:hypothetical protein